MKALRNTKESLPGYLRAFATYLVGNCTATNKDDMVREIADMSNKEITSHAPFGLIRIFNPVKEK